MSFRMGVGGVVVMLAGLLAPALSRAAVVDNQRLPFSAVVFDECTGEDVSVEGIFHTTFSQVVLKDGTIKLKFKINAHGDGVGLDSGDDYLWNDTIHEGVIFVDPAFSDIFHQHFRLTTKGNADNSDLLIDLVLIVDADGNVFFDVVEVEVCHG